MNHLFHSPFFSSRLPLYPLSLSFPLLQPLHHQPIIHPESLCKHSTIFSRKRALPDADLYKSQLSFASFLFLPHSYVSCSFVVNLYFIFFPLFLCRTYFCIKSVNRNTTTVYSVINKGVSALVLNSFNISLSQLCYHCNGFVYICIFSLNIYLYQNYLCVILITVLTRIPPWLIASEFARLVHVHPSDACPVRGTFPEAA